MPIGMLFFLPVTEILIDTGISTDRTYPHTHLESLVLGRSGFLQQAQLDSWTLNLVFKGNLARLHLSAPLAFAVGGFILEFPLIRS